MARVFISHAHSQQGLAKRLADGLANAGLTPILDSSALAIGDDLLRHVLYSVESSDFVLLLMPVGQGSEARWLRHEMNEAIGYKLRSRNISVVPVYLGRKPVDAPASGVVSFAVDFDEHGEPSDKSIEKIATSLRDLPRIQFDRLGPAEFERLVVALLEKLRFFDIESNTTNDYGFDLLARTRARNPFGGLGIITWLVEIKYRNDSRADISALHQLSSRLERFPLETNGVLITNGQLTSTAREWVEENRKRKRTSITIVDGTQLREMLIRYPALVDQFFPEV
ncbi:restriction endonuclease [Rhodoferax sp. U2-2l]|uniref:restriction endonuclease n=1 Tax=Rhodoferax sp. U2-2l TaxID=2884000 RepID=UPI001D0B8AE5|nr:restriction endonuclease [Rhodoferax sp. U2-2l]MCB8745829.1 restriction endonuclease [Rhodoferax sp. U2-2l]